jgi:hypothetical protein
MADITNIDDLFPSNFLRAADLGGKEVDVTIDKVTTQEFEEDGKKRMKPVVHFRNAGLKPLVCNKTNAMLIATALGSKDPRTWPSKQIRLYPDLISFKGKVNETVRVKRTPAPIAEELNDSINI